MPRSACLIVSALLAATAGGCASLPSSDTASGAAAPVPNSGCLAGTPEPAAAKKGAKTLLKWALGEGEADNKDKENGSGEDKKNGKESGETGNGKNGASSKKAANEHQEKGQAQDSATAGNKDQGNGAEEEEPIQT